MQTKETTTTPEKQQAIPFPGDLRDWFAGQALGSMRYDWFDSGGRVREMTEEAYNIADAMLAARKEAKP